MALKPGTRLGRYEVVSLIGAGGMGEVYKGRDTELDRDVAIKVLLPRLASKPELVDRFEREARTVAALNHPNICVLYDIGRQDGAPFIVLEFLPGETLAARLRKGPLPLNQALRYATQVSDALDKAHRTGVTHRDVKPGNIMLVPGMSGGTGAKLLDFGLAKLKQQALGPVTLDSQAPTPPPGSPQLIPTIQGAILGTLHYMAPEQVEGRIDDIDGRTDIFGFGATVFEMVTGKKAFEGQSQASVIGAITKVDPPPMTTLEPKTPPALDRAVQRCLHKEQDQRWQTAIAISPDGKNIVYVATQSRDREGAGAPPGASGFSAGKPRMLFGGPYLPTSGSLPNYDVTPDGQRFLMVKATEQAAGATQINVVQNWFEELKKKVPTK